MITSSLLRLLAERRNVRLIFFGDKPPNLAEALIAEFHEKVPPGDYYEKLASLDLDVSLGPLLDSVGNDARGSIKFIDTAATGGGAFVASDVGPYRRDLRHGDNALLAENREDAWVETLLTVVDDADLRARLMEKARKHVEENCTIATTGSAWARALRVTL